MESRTNIIVIVVTSCAILVGFICCMVAVFYTGPDTTPVLEYRPLPREENKGSNIIRYNLGNGDDTQHWIDSLNEVMKPYHGSGKSSNQEFKHCSDDNPSNEDAVCIFDYQYLKTHCNWAELWRYNRKPPCVILRMSNVIGWVPDVYNKTDIDMDLLPEDMPDDLKDQIKQSAMDNGGEPSRMVWVSCSGENSADQEYLGPIEYTPWQGFPAYYFPYMMNQPGYLPPLVAIRLVEPVLAVMINIQCRVWAKNIIYSKEERSGMVHFELLRD